MHNINAYIGRQSAWHKLGTVTGHYMSWAEIQAHGGLDYVVFKSQLHDGLGRLVDAWGTYRWNRADVIAKDGAKATFLGTVGEDYEVIQHSQGFKMIDALVSSVDGAHYETAGALGKGERVWGLADLGLSVTVGGVDKQKGYLLFCTGHDGSLSHQFRICMTRVVCQNTLSAALSEKTRASLTIRHTKNAQDRLANVSETLASIQSDLSTVESKLNFLATRKLTRESLTSILDRLYPKPKVQDGDTQKESSTRRNNVLAEVLAMYESNDGNAFPQQKGTAYNLLNAITEHTDHARTSRGDNRAESSMFGSGERLKTQAMQVVYESAQSLTPMPTVTTYAPLAPKGNGGLLDMILDS